jgi:predicted Zn-dependent protease
VVPEPLPVPEVVETKPLGDINTHRPKLEELQPGFVASELQNEAKEAAANAVSQEDASNSAQQLLAEPVVEEPKPEPVVEAPPAFLPLDSFAPLSPAVGALASSANINSHAGNIDAATTAIERAIRIEPRNATLYYKLALLRLRQSKPRLAEDLAKKAALLASNDATMKKHSWLLIARAREVQGDINGGKEARAKADSF